MIQPAGQLICSRYRVESLIGAGGMGKVYQGSDIQTGTPVAIKQLKPELLYTDPDLMTRFRREGEMLRQLNHPNIVKLLDTVEENDQNYLILEYVPGDTLEHLLSSGALPIQRIILIALDLADALTRAHRLGIIHRDLKPANVLMSSDGTPRLTDFGVAHLETPDRLTQTGTAIGTLDYLSPEALQGQTVDLRTDIWSFGVMLFEMVAGRRPFGGETIYHLMQSIVKDPLPDLEKLRPDCPVALVDLIYRMLQKDRDARIRSVRQIGVELEALLRGENVENVSVGGRFGSAPVEVPVTEKIHTLPAQTTPFVGRESELTELASTLSSTRLITILGPGGMGKTRLALELAERELSHYEHGVYFVDLAPLSTPASIIPALSEALNFTIQPGARTPQQQIQDYLANKHLLLVMDNYEHLVAGAGLVNDLLKTAPRLRILVTSRQRLNQTGETIFNLEGMGFPTWETPADALEYAAVKLFMQSARRVMPDFELTTENMDYVARICRFVQGMPLGILLAASWLAMLTPSEIAAEIEGSFDFLSNDISDLPERQRSIRAVFEYSWNLMSAQEQQVFMKLSVFRGGFTREAAAAVTGATLPVLMSLMNKSLIRRSIDTGRFDIHELLRQYAAERLHDSGLEESVRESHKTYFSDLMLRHNAGLKGHRVLELLDMFDPDFENCRAAWNHALTQLDCATLLKMDDTFMLICTMRSRGVDGDDIFGRAEQILRQNLHDPRVSRRVWGRVTSRALRFTRNAPNLHDLVQQLQVAIDIARESSADEDLMFGLWVRSRLEIGLGNMMEAVDVLKEAISISRKLGDDYSLSGNLFQASAALMFAAQLDDAMVYMQESLTIARRSGAINIEGQVLGNMGSYYLSRDNLSEAERLYTESRVIQKRVGNRWAVAFVDGELALTAWRKGDFETLHRLAQQCYAEAQDIVEAQLLGLADVVVGLDAATRGDYVTCKVNCERHRNHFNLYVQNHALLGLATAGCGLQDWALVHEVSRILAMIMLMLNDPHGAAAVLVYEAIALAHEDQPERALELMALAFTYPRTINTGMQKWDLLTDLRARLTKELGRDAYDAWERGKNLDPQTVVNELLA